jgi:RNA polymerase sigma factor (sigma-70 family)
MDLRALIKETPALSEQEERELVTLAKSDRKARERVGTAYLFLVWQIASEIVDGEHIEEAIAEGTLGLLLAIDGYDPTLGKRFASYVAASVRSTIQTWNLDRIGMRRVGNSRVERHFEPLPEHLSMDEPVGGDDFGDYNRHDIIAAEAGPTPEESAVRAVDVERVRAALHVLTPRERAVVGGRYAGDGRTLEDLATSLGASRQYVDAEAKRAVAKLRAELGERAA